MRSTRHVVAALLLAAVGSLVTTPATATQDFQELMAIGREQESQKHWAQAAATYNDLIFHEPENAMAYYRLGRVRERLGNFDGAVAAYETALGLEPELAAARSALAGYWMYRGLMARQQQKSAEAVAAFEHAVEATPDSASAHLELGRTLEQDARLGEAAQAYETASALDAEGVEAPARLGAVRAHQGQHAKAVAAYRQAAERNPRDPEVQHGLGRSYAALGRNDEAVKALQHAIRYYVTEGREDKAIEAENLEQQLLGKAAAAKHRHAR